MRLRVCFFISLALLLIHMTTEAAVPLKTCSWIGSSSTGLFTDCMNSNFKTIRKASGLDLSSCLNFSDKLEYGFQICARKNFKHINQRLKLNLQTCNAIGDEVNVFYVQCVQKNFKSIGKAL